MATLTRQKQRESLSASQTDRQTAQKTQTQRLSDENHRHRISKQWQFIRPWQTFWRQVGSPSSGAFGD